MKNERIVILGAGESGVGAALLAKSKGLDVFVSDYGHIEGNYKWELIENDIAHEEGQHTEALILNASTIVKSPGIADTVSIIKKIKEKNISIISEIEFGGLYTKAKMLCITGTNGKTTTTTWAHHILKKGGLKVGLAGNIGKSLARQIVEDKYEVYVLELSSFQLEGMFQFKADVSILLNITPDHLDRYDDDMEKYVDAKMRIVRNQTKDDFTIYCSDDQRLVDEIKSIKPASKVLAFSYAPKSESIAAVYNDLMKFEVPNCEPLSVNVRDIAINGKHNAYNSMAAGISAFAMNVKKDIIAEALKDFEGVEHRLENVGQVEGVKFNNDSKATNVNAAWYALDSMSTPVVWIAGGIDKGNDYSELELVIGHVKALICLGEDTAKLHKTFDGKIPTVINAATMEDAIAQSMKLAECDDTVLLSPACASFDLYKNYEERGLDFKSVIRSL
ncbi:MAG: UDP-N-acetylmuramoyl-L-alanine--D-glutamate ligase [Bacteroidales bacterium]|jgi:UDP-N-acetylmuramoylalanine--D-glutamate ligase|nr:UDP-N-acetylmuramoyl-L-alanine--D-glutamate ligase [Bacteroidales bacterium]